MKITKILVIMLALVLALSLFACGDGNEEATTDAPDNQTTAENNDGTTDGTEPGGDTEATQPGGDTEATEPGDDTDGTEPGDDTDGTEPGGDTDGTESETDTDEPACEHKNTAADTADHCIVKCADCGESIGESKHTVTFTAYVANESSNEAMISGTCSACNDTVTKLASFFYNIETIYGAADGNLVVFQATQDGNPAPIRGNEKLAFAEGHPFYPANGLAPIALDCTIYDGAYNGMVGVQGWCGYFNGALTDGAAYKIVDAEGNVLVDWTAIQPILGYVNTERSDVVATLTQLYTDGASAGIGFAHIVDLKPYWGTLGGKTVTIELAFTTAQGVDGDVYIPYAGLQVTVPVCEHTPGEATAENKCNITCTKCGTLLEEGKHTMGEWAIDAEGPQNEVASCSVCGEKKYQPATTTLEGLTLLSPEYLASRTKHANLSSVTVETDENGMKYYHAVGVAGGAEATLLFNDGNQAMMGVGNYLVMLVKKNSGTNSIEAWINYAGRTNHTDGNGNKSTANLAPSFKCDNTWQLVIYDFTGKEQISVENGIGWSRFDVMNGTIVEGETVDIAFAGFFSSMDKIVEYYAAYINAYFGKDNCFNHIVPSYGASDEEGYTKGTCIVCEKDFNEKIQFTVCLDKGNCSLNGERGALVAGGRKIDEPWVIDASAYTLTKVDGIGIGGWCVTPEGIEKYQFRVVSVDGTPVENPELIDYFTGAQSSGITAVGTGRGWADTCGKGAAWQAPKLLNLAGYEGKTVNVEVVATTNYGSRIVIVQINNIVVPAAQ